jgi:rubrerythrin
MTEPMVDPALDATLLSMQKGEITEYHIYTKIAAVQKDPHNREVLNRIAQDELGHYGIWKQYTHRDTGPNTARIWFYYLIAHCLHHVCDQADEGEKRVSLRQEPIDTIKSQS